MNTTAQENIEAATTANGIKEYSATEAALAELRKRFYGVIFEVATTEGDRSARAARKELVTLRTSLETKRIILKAPALDYSRRLDSEAKRITAEIKALEDPIDEQISVVDRAREAEQKRKADEEAARIKAHQDRIAAIRHIPPDAATGSSDLIAAKIAWLAELDVGAAFEEFADQARAAKTETLALLGALRQAAVAREAEAVRLAAERVEFERLRAEQVVRDRAEQERQAAEQARVTAEQRAENERQARARTEIDAREHAQRAEQVRIDARAATLLAQEMAAQEAARAEQERREREAKALAVEAQRKALDAAEQAADRVREAAPLLLAALKRLIDRDLTYFDNMAGPISRKDVEAGRNAISAAAGPQESTTHQPQETTA